METKENQPQIPPIPSSQNESRWSLSSRPSLSVGIKALVVGVLTLLLLIPLGMVRGLISERQSSKYQAVQDITSKWGREQTITGPCLVIPYTEFVTEDRKKVEVKRNLLLLPETLDVNGNVSVEKRKRGIYDASVYGSDIVLSGEFNLGELSKLNVDADKFRWREAQVILGLSDLKGIKETVVLQSNGQNINFEPGLAVDNLAVGEGGIADIVIEYGSRGSDYSLFNVGLNAKFNSIQETSAQGNIPFKIKLSLNGSQGLYVVPIGKTTSVNLKSDWDTPKFDGEFLPTTHNVTNDGFTSDWKVLDLNRSFGQVIRADNSNAINQMVSSRFGVEFIQAVDQYQQNMRSVKYAILIILLTFVVVFFIELIKKKSVNPFQYLLVGLALVLFYTLLLSMSEVWGFNAAYFVAALMTTVLITLHMTAILKTRQQGLLIGGLLAFLYIFIFVLIQMESYALLVGSLGLFAILAVIMYFSKKIKF